jgi:hypothetical protein
VYSVHSGDLYASGDGALIDAPRLLESDLRKKGKRMGVTSILPWQLLQRDIPQMNMYNYEIEYLTIIIHIRIILITHHSFLHEFPLFFHAEAILNPKIHINILFSLLLWERYSS